MMGQVTRVTGQVEQQGGQNDGAAAGQAEQGHETGVRLQWALAVSKDKVRDGNGSGKGQGQG